MKTATNHATGERFRFDEQLNDWVPMTGAMPPLGAEHPPRQAQPPAAGQEMMREILGGPIDTLGSPVDAVNSALGYFGLGSDRPIGGSQRARDAANLPRPETPGGKAMNVLTGGALGSAGVIGRARAAPGAARDIAGTARAGQLKGQPYQSPGLATARPPGPVGPVVASEIMGNLGGAGGMAAGASMSENPLIQAALSLIGGAGAPGPIAGNVASRVDQRMQPDVRAARNVRDVIKPGPRASMVGPNAILADTTEGSQRALDRAYQQLDPKGDAVEQVSEFLTQRSMMQGEELMEQVGENVYQASKDAIARQKRSASPHYREAYATEINMTPELEELFDQPTIKRFWKSRALVESAEDAASVDRIPFDPKTIGGDPSVQGLDSLIKLLDTRIGAQLRNPNPSQNVGNLIGIRQQLRDAVRDASPELDRARSIFAGPARAEEVIDKGKTFWGGTANDTAREMGELTPGELSLYRIGAIESLEERVGRMGFTHDVTKIFRTPNAVKRMRALIPDDADYQKFQETIERLANQQRTYSKVTGGSQTAQRQANTPLDNEILGVVLDLLPKGQQVGRAAQAAARHLPGRGQTNEAMARMLIDRNLPAVPGAPPRTPSPAGFGFLSGQIPSEEEVYGAFSEAPKGRRR